MFGRMGFAALYFHIEHEAQYFSAGENRVAVLSRTISWRLARALRITACSFLGRSIGISA
ncbi:MAG: hypothetical protein J0M13_16895 [Candidatus Accumulibacter sp.]|jgi:hypothetical protein|nr:hypothetical protein [Candidatus Accumulibacter necessarius]